MRNDLQRAVGPISGPGGEPAAVTPPTGPHGAEPHAHGGGWFDSGRTGPQAAPSGSGRVPAQAGPRPDPADQHGRTPTPPGAPTSSPERHDRAFGTGTAPGAGEAEPARCPVSHGGSTRPGHSGAYTAPVPGEPDNRAYALAPEELHRLAEDFIRLHRHEQPAHGDPAARLAAVHAEIDATGTYRHTPGELAFGARVAWRNSNRCIGRLYWNSLRVRDLRHISDAESVARECADHLREAGNGGRVRPLITIFAPDTPARPGPRIWNEQLIRYAGYTAAGGDIVGDPRNTGLTELAMRLGWRGGPGTAFDVLPLIVQGSDEKPRQYQLPDDAVLEVPLAHPEDTWAQEWGLRWHAVPAISHMCLEIGGICYPCAPFNGWYMGTEIGARNLADADRYNLLEPLARRLGLDTSTDRSLWKDRALVELNRAVLHSFDRAGVTMADHHTESERFLTHLEREEARGREVAADWSWIVPPMSSAATPVFHRTYDNTELTPLFTHHEDALVRARGEGPY